MHVSDVHTEGANPFPPVTEPSFVETPVGEEVRCLNRRMARPEWTGDQLRFTQSASTMPGRGR